MIEQVRKNEIIDEVLKVQQSLRAITKPMTNEERVFFLESLRTGAKAALDVFEGAVQRGFGNNV